MSGKSTNPGPCEYFDFPECHLAVLLWTVISPVFILVGVLGNLISIAVLSRRRMRNSTTSVYLRFLAVVDILVLIIGNFRELLYYATSFDIRELNNLSCRIHYWLAIDVTALSGWMLSVLSVDRLISIKFPLWAKSQCTVKSALSISIIITGVMLMINSHVLGFLERTEILVPSQLANTTIVLNVMCLPSAPLYMKFWIKIWPILVFTLYSILPIVCITTCNILLVKELAKRKNPLGATTFDSRQSSKQRNEKSLTRMLIVISLYFTTISLPTCIYLNVESYIFSDKSAQDIATRRLAWAIVSLIMYSNNTINFILYCVSGSLFRKELKQMCLKIKTATTKCMNRRTAPLDISYASSSRKDINEQNQLSGSYTKTRDKQGPGGKQEVRL